MNEETSLLHSWYVENKVGKDTFESDNSDLANF